MYRVFNSSPCIVLGNMFRRSNVLHELNARAHNLNFYIFPCSTNIRKNFIVNIGSKLWNNLSNIFGESKPLSICKKTLRNNLFWDMTSLSLCNLVILNPPIYNNRPNITLCACV